MGQCIIAHDLGTTGDKATLFSDEGKLIASFFSPYNTYYPKAGWAEQNPYDYWNAFCETTKALVSETGIKPTDVAVVSFSGQMMAALPVDKDGNALRNSIIWADLRSTKQAREIAGIIGEDSVYRLTGHRLSASYSASKIMWIRENEPDVYKKTDKFIHAKDYVVSRLTGMIYSDYSDASGTNLLNISTLEWSDELLAAAGIDKNKLPELIESTQLAGKLTRDAASQCGLAEGTAVAIGGGDGPCATCGAGVVKSGEAYIYLGTSTWMGLATEKPLIDPQQRTATFSHFNRGLYMPAGTMQAGGGSFKWFRDVLGDSESFSADIAGLDAYDLLAKEAETVPCGSEGLIYLPYLMGERSPLWDPDARGCFVGLSMVHKKGHLVRSVLEGVAFNMRIIKEAFEEQGVDCKTIRIIGGGARSGLWRSIFADILEKPVSRLNFIDEATSVGAAIAGGVGVGLFASIQDADRFVIIEDEAEPNEDHLLTYRKYFDIFKKTYEQLKDIFQMLSD
jgi:xylulokinase